MPSFRRAHHSLQVPYDSLKILQSVWRGSSLFTDLCSISGLSGLSREAHCRDKSLPGGESFHRDPALSMLLQVWHDSIIRTLAGKLVTQHVQPLRKSRVSSACDCGSALSFWDGSIRGYGAYCSHIAHMGIKWQSHRCHWQLRPMTPEPPATVLIARTPLPRHEYFNIALLP